ncbi:phage repressor protein CI [Hafnia paralvei]|uniref:phage repressor protein CI n=1 Tax=Hafnia paralvei TaxID=546367 RepID=UPI0015F01662|nr:phage repressor protein CI [Hafnia paralvei]
MKFDGGKAVVQRILQAYGFTMQKQLHDHLGVGNGTVSTWIKRNYFPGEVVIRCALETGADLEWLATGNGVSGVLNPRTARPNSIIIPKLEVSGGLLNEIGVFAVDEILTTKLLDPCLLVMPNNFYIVDRKERALTEGKWIIEKNKIISVDNLNLYPGGGWKIGDIVWPEKEIRPVAKIILKIEKEG